MRFPTCVILADDRGLALWKVWYIKIRKVCWQEQMDEVTSCQYVAKTVAGSIVQVIVRSTPESKVLEAHESCQKREYETKLVLVCVMSADKRFLPK